MRVMEYVQRLWNCEKCGQLNKTVLSPNGGKKCQRCRHIAGNLSPERGTPRVPRTVSARLMTPSGSRQVKRPGPSERAPGRAHGYDGPSDGYDRPSDGYDGPTRGYDGSTEAHENPGDRYDGPASGYDGPETSPNARKLS
jgi:hypothetical protein